MHLYKLAIWNQWSSPGGGIHTRDLLSRHGKHELARLFCFSATATPCGDWGFEVDIFIINCQLHCLCNHCLSTASGTGFVRCGPVTSLQENTTRLRQMETLREQQPNPSETVPGIVRSGQRSCESLLPVQRWRDQAKMARYSTTARQLCSKGTSPVCDFSINLET